ncbi:hypothetical protein [Methanococcoides alaskense]|uniref:Uncharacterized protein n=1 Tax=Methanococcoides alaskense TaxID=325778 RepID=A0AA90TZJ2_9EURY|nr:hypothetical protein [Methanococcoides alaskense]MDA0524796.1 hypothetical protein [Methanococcoides alaskense]MDR6223081.1 hypothetical protein [Methanococcoides alaskense]
MTTAQNDATFEASIEMTEKDFEFANHPMSMESIVSTFKKYDLRYIVIFANNMFYVAQQDLQPYHPMYVDDSYPEDIEQIFNLMTVERIRKIEYINGVLKRSPIEEHPDV